MKIRTPSPISIMLVFSILAMTISMGCSITSYYKRLANPVTTYFKRLANPVYYTYKLDTQHPIITKDDIREYPNFGVAVLCRNGLPDNRIIGRDTDAIESGINSFVHFEAKENIFYEILFTDISPIIEMDEHRDIINAKVILKKCPKMRYAIYFFEGDRDMRQSTYYEEERLTKLGKDDKDDKDDKETERIIYRTIYQTTLRLHADIVLFDLKNEVVLAKSMKVFSHSKQNIVESSMPGCGQGSYPDVELIDVESHFSTYVFHFLDRISKVQS